MGHYSYSRGNAQIKPELLELIRPRFTEISPGVYPLWKSITLPKHIKESAYYRFLVMMEDDASSGKYPGVSFSASRGFNNFSVEASHTLINPNLQGVDPFDVNLSVQVKKEIVDECMVNPRYFFRECTQRHISVSSKTEHMSHAGVSLSEQGLLKFYYSTRAPDLGHYAFIGLLDLIAFFWTAEIDLWDTMQTEDYNDSYICMSSAGPGVPAQEKAIIEEVVILPKDLGAHLAQKKKNVEVIADDIIAGTKLYTMTDIMSMMHISRSTLERRIRWDLFPQCDIRIGGYRWTERTIKAYLEWTMINKDIKFSERVIGNALQTEK